MPIPTARTRHPLRRPTGAAPALVLLLALAACAGGDPDASGAAPREPAADRPRPPAAFLELVQRVRAEEAAAGLADHAPAVVRAGWDRLVITAEDGSRHLFADEAAGDDLHSIHRFAGTAEPLPVYLIERILVPEGRTVLMVDRRTGAVTALDEIPAASPDGRRFATASLDLVAGHQPNRVRIYRMDLRGPALEWEREPREWGARRPVWEDPATLRLERGVVDWAAHDLFLAPMTVRRQGEGWAIASSVAEAGQALQGFFSAVGHGHHVEAVALYGGSYETLRGWNPELDPADLPALWRAACERNGLQCLARSEIVAGREAAPGVYRFRVRFRTSDGRPFVLGPCCGATAEEMPPQDEFDYEVRRVGDRYLVQDLPVYVP